MNKNQNKNGAGRCAESSGSAMRNEPDGALRASLEGKELVIRIGTDRLRYCARNDLGSPFRGCKIHMPMAFAESIAQQINRDDEVGHTNGGKFLDEMIQQSIDDGNPYIEFFELKR